MRERPEIQLAGYNIVHVVKTITDRDQEMGMHVVRYLCGQHTTFGPLGRHPGYAVLHSNGPVTCENCLRMLAGRKPYSTVQLT